MFEQVLDPAGNLWLTVLIALVPLIALLFMLAVMACSYVWMRRLLLLPGLQRVRLSDA